MCSFCLQEIEFFENFLVVFLGILGLVFFWSSCLEEFALTWGVPFVFSINTTINWRVLATFLTVVFTFLSLLGTLFVLHGVYVLVWGRKLGHGNVVSGINPFVLFYEGRKISSVGIEILWDQHGLVCSWHFITHIKKG